MTEQDREWVKAIVAQAIGELVVEMPKNCPMLKRVRILAFGLIIGVSLAGVGSPLVGKIIATLFQL